MGWQVGIVRGGVGIVRDGMASWNSEWWSGELEK